MLLSSRAASLLMLLLTVELDANGDTALLPLLQEQNQNHCSQLTSATQLQYPRILPKLNGPYALVKPLLLTALSRLDATGLPEKN
jgi:hypothetical protein